MEKLCFSHLFSSRRVFRRVFPSSDLKTKNYSKGRNGETRTFYHCCWPQVITLPYCIGGGQYCRANFKCALFSRTWFYRAFRAVLWIRSWVLVTDWKKNCWQFLYLVLVKNCNLNLPFPRSLSKGRLSYRRSLQPSKENIPRFQKWTL